MFKTLKTQVQVNFAKMLTMNNKLFYVGIDREVIWDNYLNGFPIDEQQGHNCNCCKSFLRQWGGIVTIVDGKKVSIWDGIDFSSDEMKQYENSILNLSNYIHSLPITDIFLNEFANCGTDKNLDSVRNVTWEHFFIVLPKEFVNKTNIDSVRGEARTTKEMFERAMKELIVDATKTVLDLIAQKSLYRGNEFESLLRNFLSLQQTYEEAKDKLVDDELNNVFWLKSSMIPVGVARIRNTAIGTLLIDLSEGVDLDTAVTKYEKVMAPANYKRPTALITPAMVKNAKIKLTEMGLIESLERRYANETDINVENIIYADKSSSMSDIFKDMAKDTLINPKTFSKVDEISIEDFIKNVIPTSKSVEVLIENSHLPNFVSLITGVNPTAKSMFKWDNLFSWSYTGGITDSIKEKVKAAGGNVDGELRVSLSWFNYDDLDLHIIEPNNNRIYFSSKLSHTTRGQLDVDMNAGGGTTRSAVENIIYPSKDRMLDGTYKVLVNNYSRRESNDTGYVIQIECRGQVVDIEVPKSPVDAATDTVIEFKYSKTDGITFPENINSSVASKDKWNVKTNKFIKVKNIMLSPNHWNTSNGNKHYMFILENCVSDESPRPFFNEFLSTELNDNRKVLEIMASKMTVEPNDYQLSGLGFSETQRNHLFVRVDGSFKRVLKVKF